MCCWLGTGRTATDDKDTVSMLCAASGGLICVGLSLRRDGEQHKKRIGNCALMEGSTDRERTN